MTSKTLFFIQLIPFLCISWYAFRYTLLKRINHFLSSIRFKTKYFLVSTYKGGLEALAPELQDFKDGYLYFTKKGIGFQKSYSLTTNIFIPYVDISNIDIHLHGDDIMLDENQLPIFVRDLFCIRITYAINGTPMKKPIRMWFYDNNNTYHINHFIYSRYNILKELYKFIPDKINIHINVPA